MGSLFSYLKMLSILLIVSGQNPFILLGLDTPRAWIWSQENKVRVSDGLIGRQSGSSSSTKTLIAFGTFLLHHKETFSWFSMSLGEDVTRSNPNQDDLTLTLTKINI